MMNYMSTYKSRKMRLQNLKKNLYWFVMYHSRHVKAFRS